MRISAIFLLVRAAIAGTLVCGASSVFAQERPVRLFAPPPAAASGQLMAAPKPIRGAARQRLVSLNLQALEQAIAPRGLDHAADRLARSPRRTPPVTLDLFPGRSGTFRKRALEAAVGGGYIWTGDQIGNGGAATLVVRDGRVTGHAELNGSLFKIEPATGALHRVIEFRPEAMPKDAPHLKPQSSNAPTPSTTQGGPTISEASTPITAVDVLVAYTTAARLAAGDILAEINLAVKLTNSAYANSAVSMRIRLRGTLQVAGYNESSTSYSATLADLTGVNAYGSTATGRAAFAPTRRLRDQIGADLVTLVRVGGGYCGQGWLIEAPSAQTAGYGYSQFSLDCISSFVMAHELGHNMGLRHDRYVEPTAPASKYNYGFVHLSKRMRDIMSYPNRCSVAGVVCAVKNLFSNPRKLVNNVPFGIPAGKPGASDGSRRLNETRLKIAAYRAAVGTVSARPSAAAMQKNLAAAR